MAAIALEPEVVMAILAKEKAHCLPLYLTCLYNQTYDKKKIHLYIRTNDNADETSTLLEQWLEAYGDLYASVHFDKSDIDPRVKQYKPHDWNGIRFTVLGKIRQDSIQYAIDKGADYFVVDCDNFIKPDVLKTLVESGLPAVAPILYTNDTLYSNYHNKCDPNGYYLENPDYRTIWSRSTKGFIECDVIHCTYYYRNKILPHVKYLDNTARHEYVIVSHNLRKAGIPQYLDNRKDYGKITFHDNAEGLMKEGCLKESWLPKIPGINAEPEPEDAEEEEKEEEVQDSGEDD